MSNCQVSNEIAKHCDEPDPTECECGSSMTQHDGNDFLTCDDNCEESKEDE